jgi:hypothetical protein
MKTPPQKETVYVGLKFKSVHFSDDAEIKAIRENENQCDVELVSSQGHARIEKNWNLQRVKWGFDRGEYKEKPIDEFKTSVY